jgi:hypothetical protein
VDLTFVETQYHLFSTNVLAVGASRRQPHGHGAERRVRDAHGGAAEPAAGERLKLFSVLQKQ